MGGTIFSSFLFKSPNILPNAVGLCHRVLRPNADFIKLKFQSNDGVDSAICDFLLVFSALLQDLSFQNLRDLELDLSRLLGV